MFSILNDFSSPFIESYLSLGEIKFVNPFFYTNCNKNKTKTINYTLQFRLKKDEIQFVVKTRLGRHDKIIVGMVARCR
jgi:hypothetical protein